MRHGGGARRTGPTELQRRHRLVVHVAPQHRPSPCWPAAVDLVLRQWQRERVEEAVESAAKGHRPASNRSAASQCPAAATRGNNKTRRLLTLYCANASGRGELHQKRGDPPGISPPHPEFISTEFWLVVICRAKVRINATTTGSRGPSFARPFRDTQSDTGRELSY